MQRTENRSIKILHLEDLPTDAELVERALKKGGIDFEKIIVDNKIDFENALDKFLPDIILSDHSLPSFDSIQALQIVKQRNLRIPFILITSTMTDEFAVTIMRGGADDYIIKDRLHRVPTAVINCLEKFRLEKEKEKFLEQIAENEVRFRALIEKSMDMKMLSTPEGKFIYGSPSVEVVFGYSPKEFLLKPASDFFHPDDIHDFLKSRAAIAEKLGASFSFQYRLLHKNGNWIWCEGTLTNFLHEPGINAFVANFRDISERKKIEKKLKDSEAFNRGILNSLTSHIAVVNSLGNIIAVNDSWRRFAAENGDTTLLSTGTGANYYSVCEKAVMANADMAQEALQGMKDVFSGVNTDFYLEYPCHSPTEKRWFGMRVMKFESNEPMIVVTHQNITERKKTEEEILDINIQLKSLLNIAQTIREEERKNVAREIHDELGQQLTALKMDIDWILHKQNNQDVKVLDKLNEMLKMNDGIINTVRRISSDLRPAIIDDLGLIATIEWKCNDFEEKSKIKCRFISSFKERNFSKNFSINVYRIFQETLTNVARHAEASKVNVFLSGNEKELVLEIKDNGKGVSEENTNNTKRLGILGMKERANLLEGVLTITGNVASGTCVKLILSLENENINS